jgi:hypothetical protein
MMQNPPGCAEGSIARSIEYCLYEIAIMTRADHEFGVC